MGAMSPKHNSLPSHALGVQATLLGTIIPLLGTPHDGLKAQIYGDDRTKIVTNYADVIVGDLAYSGGVCGTVTGIAANDIEVTFNTPYMQTPAASTVENRVVNYPYDGNAAAENDGSDKVENPNAISGRGVVFVRILDLP